MNGIYGTQAMDVFRPDFTFSEEGNMLVDSDTKVTPENFESKKPKNCNVLYTYGLRIVAGSRQHLVIAIELLWDAFGDSITITGGDTDSLKISTPESIEPDELLQALAPLEQAVDEAISLTMHRVRTRYGNHASKLEGVGHFDYEGTQDWHLEGWNKARVSATAGKSHITCAGLRRPDGAYHIETWMDELLKTHAPDSVLPWVLGYNGIVADPVCHALEHYRPQPTDIFDADITDYLGHSAHVHSYQSIALYSSHRELGSTLKKSNADNVAWLQAHGYQPETREHLITVDGSGAVLYVDSGNGLERWF